MKRKTRIIIGILVIGILSLNSFYFLPNESLLYLKNDITNFKKSLMPISIIFSMIITFLIVFDRTEYNEGKMSKIMYLIYIGMMCYIVYPLVSGSVMTIGLKTNRLSSNELITEKFIVTVKDSYGDLDNTVWGRIPNKTEYGKTEKLKLSQVVYDKVKKNQEIELKLKIGLLGVPYDPIIKE